MTKTEKKQKAKKHSSLEVTGRWKDRQGGEGIEKSTKEKYTSREGKVSLAIMNIEITRKTCPGQARRSAKVVSTFSGASTGA